MISTYYVFVHNTVSDQFHFMNLYFKIMIPRGTLTCNVIDHHGHSGVPYVTGNEAPEALLSCGVP